MRAVYHDTADLTLFRWGITLRRREGGHDEGWHMKLPVAGADGSTRDEMRLPLESGQSVRCPSGVRRGDRAAAARAAADRRWSPCRPSARRRSSRTPTAVPRAELVDDIVTVLREGRVGQRLPRDRDRGRRLR